MRIHLYWCDLLECWALFDGPYLYTHRWMLGAIWQWIRNRGNDRFLVG